jgi:hypothetical protein
MKPYFQQRWSQAQDSQLKPDPQKKQVQLELWPGEQVGADPQNEEDPPALQKKWDQSQNSQLELDRFKNYLIDERSIDESLVDQLFTTGQLSARYRYNTPCIMARYQNLETGSITNIQELSIVGKEKYFQTDLEAGGNSFFQLGQLIAAAGQIIILEGVIDCITAYQLAPQACCIALGSAGYTGKISKFLKKLIKEDTTVCTYFDNDAPGKRATIRTTIAMDRTIYQVIWPEIEPPGMNINRLLKDQRDELILDMLEQAQPLTPEEAREQLPPGDEAKRIPIQYTTLARIADDKYEDVPIIKGLIHEEDTVMLDGDGGLGKTALLQYIALAGGSYPSPVTPQDKQLLFDTFEIVKPITTIFMQSETPKTFIGLRQQLMAQGDPRLMRGAGRVIMPERNGNVMVIGEQIEGTIFQQYIKDFINRVEDDFSVPVDFLMIDPLISFHGSPENDNVAMRRALDIFWEILNGKKTVFIFAHHDKKDDEKKQYRGAQAIWDFARNVIHMESAVIGDQQVIKLENSKRNNRQKFKTIHLKRNEFLNFQLISDTDALSKKQKSWYRAIANIFDELREKTMTNKQLSNAYQESEGTTPATAKRHISDAVKYRYIDKIPCSDPNVKAQYLYMKG